MSPNPVDWVLAVLFGIPLLVVSVCWLVVWAEERDRCSCEHCEQQR